MSASFLSRHAHAISWFPGHMAKAAADLSARVRSADVVLEVRDARLPFTSANPLLDALAGGKPRVVVFNKADLANPQLQGRVVAAVVSGGAGAAPPSPAPSPVAGTLLTHAPTPHAPPRGHVHDALFTDARRGTNVPRLLAAIDGALAAAQTPRARSYRTGGAVLLVVGVPNTGKSSLINALRGAARFTPGRGAKTGAAPGITRSVSLLQVRGPPHPLFLADTPGVLPPRVGDVEDGMKLLVTGAVRDSAAPASAAADWLHCYLCAVGSTRYAPALGLDGPHPEGAAGALLAELAGRLRASLPGGAPDLEAAARHMVRTFQEGGLGRYTLDHVPQLPGAGGAAAGEAG